MKLTKSIPEWLLLVLFSAFVYGSSFIPAAPLDPWGLVSLKSLAAVLSALGLIQVFGSFIIHKIGLHDGSIIHGFFSGLISSTALTASIARASRTDDDLKTSIKSVALLSGTLAMLIQGFLIVIVNLGFSQPSLFILFIGPTVMTLFLIFLRRNKTKERRIESLHQESFKIFSLLKLAIFILIILSGSKLLQKVYGTEGLFLLTFLVSLFEIHGSLIANTELFEQSNLGLNTYASLISLSILASYLSKLGLVFFTGSNYLKKRTSIWFFYVLLSQLLCWFVFYIRTNRF